MGSMVKVKLDKRRPYRADAKDRTAVWVGPGEAEVPAWVAKAWGLEPIQPPQPEPKDDEPETEEPKRKRRKQEDGQNG